MREIKFRVYDKSVKCMYYFEIGEHGKFTGVSQELIDKSGNPNLSELMQFTGLKDKNGKEIWEGDVVQGASRENGGHFISEVIGEVGHGGMAFHFAGKKKDGTEWFYTITTPTYTQDDAVKVIGNVHENPELLK